MRTRRWPSRKRPTKLSEVSPSGSAGPTGISPLSLSRSDGRDPAGPAEPDGESQKPRRRFTARKTALDLLSRREHSVAELRAKLEDREFPADEIEATLAALQREGLLSEARFLESFIGSHARRGHGPVWIRAELERKGIAGEAIREALEAAEVDWDAEAEAVRVKRFGTEPPADFKERARQARFLQYRGYRTRLLD